MTTHTHLDDSALQSLAEGRGAPAAEAHLAGCASCSEALTGWRDLFAELNALEDPAPDALFAGEVMARVDAVAAARTRRSWVPAAGVLGITLAAVAAVAVFVLSGGSFGTLVTGAAGLAVGVAKIRVILGDLLAAVPTGAGAVLLVAQILFLFALMAVLSRLVRAQEPVAVEAA